MTLHAPQHLATDQSLLPVKTRVIKRHEQGILPRN